MKVEKHVEKRPTDLNDILGRLRNPLNPPGSRLPDHVTRLCFFFSAYYIELARE
jgi:hypothetical protein